MKTLSRYDLEQERAWRTRNFETALAGVFSTLDFFKHEAERAVARPRCYDREMGEGEMTAGDVVSGVISALTQMVSNYHLGSLAEAAAELDAVEQMLVALDRTLAELPSEVRAAYEVWNDNRAADERERREADAAKREEKRRTQCNARRGCSRRGTFLAPNGKLYCFQHEKEGDGNG